MTSTSASVMSGSGCGDKPRSLSLALSDEGKSSTDIRTDLISFYLDSSRVRGQRSEEKENATKNSTSVDDDNSMEARGRKRKGSPPSSLSNNRWSPEQTFSSSRSRNSSGIGSSIRDSKETTPFHSERSFSSGLDDTPPEAVENRPDSKRAKKVGAATSTSTTTTKKLEQKKKMEANVNVDQANDMVVEPGSDRPAVFEIEEILDYVKETGRGGSGERYLIKWRGYPPEDNTWEPPTSLFDCEDALTRFFYKRREEVEKQLQQIEFTERSDGTKRRKTPLWKIPPDPRPLSIRIADFLESTRPLVKNKVEEIGRDMLAIGKKKASSWSETKLSKMLNKAEKEELNKTELESLRMEIYAIEVDRTREDQLVDLKVWEKEINKVTKKAPAVVVENDVDLIGPRKDFKFIADYEPGEGVVIPTDPPMGCGCSSNGCLDNRSNCCGPVSGSEFAYDRHKKVRIPPNRPIYECNKKCSCTLDCVNRVVQNGATPGLKLAIFRTKSCGWGVKTLRKIKRGTFICLYVGEVITQEEAAKRDDWTYFFDLDFNSGEGPPPFTVDAKRRGGLATFINHSCEPNLSVYNVWVDCLDPDLPKIAFFAHDEIQAGEELSFDYSNSGEEDSSDSDATKGKRKCYCGAATCRKFFHGN